MVRVSNLHFKCAQSIPALTSLSSLDYPLAHNTIPLDSPDFDPAFKSLSFLPNSTPADKKFKRDLCESVNYSRTELLN